MSSSANSKKLDRLILNSMANGFPQSLQIQVTRKNKLLFKKKYGHQYKFFDLASLTKIFVTTPLIMKLIDENLIALGDKLESHLPFFKGTSLGAIQVIRLLNHSSGVIWWRPFYKILNKLPFELRKPSLQKMLRGERLSKIGQCVYSDLDMMILGWVIEDKFQMNLNEAYDLNFVRPLGLKDTFFVFNEQISKAQNIKQFAPTGREGKTVIRGIVHDQNARALGGVSGNSGLFSTPDETSKIAQIYFQTLKGKKNPVFSQKTMKKFSKRSVTKRAGDWALGFSIPSRPVSSGGKKISKEAFGHTGFTGTSVWIDPVRETVVTVLSNRTYPSAKDERFLQLRRDIHDAVWEMIDG